MLPAKARVSVTKFCTTFVFVRLPLNFARSPTVFTVDYRSSSAGGGYGLISNSNQLYLPIRQWRRRRRPADRTGGAPNLISNADLANPNCAPTYHPQFMRRPCYESPRRGGRVFGVLSCIYPRRFDINFHTYYAIVARVTHGSASASAAITTDGISPRH